MSSTDRIDDRLDKVDHYYGVASPEARERADEIIPWAEIYRIKDGESYVERLRSKLREKKQAKDDGDRTKPLCRCADAECHVKRGRLPPQCVPRPGLDDFEPGARSRVRRELNGDHPHVALSEANREVREDEVEILPQITEAVSVLEADVESENRLD